MDVSPSNIPLDRPPGGEPIGWITVEGGGREGWGPIDLENTFIISWRFTAELVRSSPRVQSKHAIKLALGKELAAAGRLHGSEASWTHIPHLLFARIRDKQTLKRASFSLASITFYLICMKCVIINTVSPFWTWMNTRFVCLGFGLSVYLKGTAHTANQNSLFVLFPVVLFIHLDCFSVSCKVRERYLL